MSDDFDVNITGLVELQDALEQMPPKVSKRGLRQALRAGAVPVRDGMVELAPKESGFLAEHIDIKTKLQSDELAGTAFIGPNSKVLYPRKPGWPSRVAKLVAKWIEFGTSRMAARPFMTQAWETRKQAALDAMVVKLGEVVEQVANESPKGPQV